jgi:parallel beta-helix repeat protein
VVAYNWRSDKDGFLSDKEDFDKPASELSIGTHTIYLKVQDDNGALSNEVTEDLTVVPPAVPPSITSFSPPSPVSDYEGATRTFNITVDQIVNVSWLISGTEVFSEIEVTESAYTNASATVGIWNVSAIISNPNGTAMQTWDWIVTKPIYGVDLAVNVPALTTAPSVNATYLLTVGNTGTVSDSYTLSIENLDNADVAVLNKSYIAALPAGANATVLLNVTDATAGTYRVNVTATSEGNVSIKDTISTTTTVSGGPTYVSGIISSDTTWTAAGSPYIVTGNILVKEGVTLTIEPGVVVKFNSAKGLQIDGELIARGTEAEQIVFTSNQSSPAPGDWANILFTNSSVDATFDEHGNYIHQRSIMQYCTVEYGGGSDTPVIKIVRSSPLLDYCTITKNARRGIYVEGEFAAGAVKGLPKITNNTITHNGAEGIIASWGGENPYGGWDPKYGIVTISGNTISNNSGKGICATRGTFTLNGNTISNNAGSGIHATYCSYTTINGNTISSNSGDGIYANHCSFTISGNTISNNSGSGIHDYDSWITISDNTIFSNSGWGIYRDPMGPGYHVTGNIISNNSGGGIYYINTWGGERFRGTFSGNTISNNSGSGIYVHISGTMNITGNVISNNSASIGSGIYCDSGTININYNELSGNSGDGIYIKGNPVINYNNLLGNTPYEVRNGKAQGTYVDCTNNWWGTNR